VTDTQTSTEVHAEVSDVDPTTDTRITAELLRVLGACDEYPRRFQEKFPVTEYPDGVEPTPEVCVAHANDFDWSWASAAMLTPDAHRRCQEAVDGRGTTRRWSDEREAIRQERIEARRVWQDEYQQPSDYPDWNASDEAKDAYNAIENRFSTRLEDVDRRVVEERAVRFAELYADPANHGDGLRAARLKVDEIAESNDAALLRDAQQYVNRAERAIRDGEASIRSYRETVERYQQELPGYQAKLDELTTAVEDRRRTRERRRQLVAVAAARRAVEEAQRRLTEAENKLTETQQPTTETDAA
jgi:hypothetical protein